MQPHTALTHFSHSLTYSLLSHSLLSLTSLTHPLTLPTQAVTELSATVTGSEGSIMGVPVDVCDSAQVHAVADKTVARFGKVDLWINNAALSVAQTGPMEDLSPEELHRIVNTNLLGVMYGFQAAMRVMTPLKVRPCSLLCCTLLTWLAAHNTHHTLHSRVASSTLVGQASTAGRRPTLLRMVPQRRPWHSLPRA